MNSQIISAEEIIGWLQAGENERNKVHECDPPPGYSIVLPLEGAGLAVNTALQADFDTEGNFVQIEHHSGINDFPDAYQSRNATIGEAMVLMALAAKDLGTNNPRVRTLFSVVGTALASSLQNSSV